MQQQRHLLGLGGIGFFRRWRRLLSWLPLLLFIPPFLFSRNMINGAWNSKSEGVRSSRSKKFDHLIFGPTTGQGVPSRLQCDGFRAVNGASFLGASHQSRRNESLSVVTFFKVYNSSFTNKRESEKLTVVGNTSYDKAGRALAILDVFTNFIKISMPGSDVIILTDPSSGISSIREGVSLFHIKGEYARENLMLQRIRSYIAFLTAKLEEDTNKQKHIIHYIFTDSDMAIVDDLMAIFDSHPNFHIALTFRNNKDQPLNSGLIAVRGTQEGILKAKKFLEEVLNVYVSKFMGASRMLGDQLSLAWVVKQHLSYSQKMFMKPKAFLEDVNGALVLFLPCLLYNWTPPEGAGQFHGMPVDVKVIHFKGSRKRLMLEAWNFLNSTTSPATASLSDMMCLILMSGRTKYDF